MPYDNLVGLFVYLSDYIIDENNINEIKLDSLNHIIFILTN